MHKDKKDVHIWKREQEEVYTIRSAYNKIGNGPNEENKAIYNKS